MVDDDRNRPNPDIFQRNESDEGSPDVDVADLVRALRDQIVHEARPERFAPYDRYSNLASLADDLIFVANLEGTIDYVNPALANFLGDQPEHLVGQPVETLGLFSSSNEAEEMLARVILSEEVVRFERAIQRGARTKHLYTTLSPMKDSAGDISGILGIGKDVSELAQAMDELRALTLVDELTGVYNRRGFTSLAGQHFNLAQRNGTWLCLIIADLDRLKVINDRFGHHQGDAALISLASILKSNCRNSDVVARIGGDEFALLATGIGEGSSDFLVARLKQAISNYDVQIKKPYSFSASVGAIECQPGPHHSLERLMADADRNMYEVKRSRAS